MVYPFGRSAEFLRLFAVLAWFAGFVLHAVPSHGAAGPWSATDHGAVRLIAASDAVGEGETLRLGLHFTMKPGWKIYWRSPGDAGFPPQPGWTGSTNLASVAIDWPVPERFTVLGLETLGYTDEVVLPLRVVPFEPGAPVALRARVPYLTCSEICVPYEADLSLDLPAGPETTAREARLIERFAARVPGKGPDASLSVATAEIDGAPGAQQLRVVAHAAGRFTRPDLLIEGPPGFRFGPPKMVRLENGPESGRAVMQAAVSPPPAAVKTDPAADLAGAELVVTVIDGDRAIEQRVEARRGLPALPPSPAAPGPVSAADLLGILGLALLGGLILNLMPCVLPVLSLKLLSVVGHGGADRRTVRAGFLASAAGIVTSFLVLGSAAVALKAAGLAAGWGIQFQQPPFLAAMAVILALFAANLWGLFEIRLPRAVADAAAGAGHGRRRGLAGHFATGAFATLLATPCSAPFLGTAVGFALARGAVEIYAIFAVLGLGLALPYILIAALPGLATRLPRPGPWMVTLRRILGLALAGTAVWLLSVLETQAGLAAALVGGGLVAAAVALLPVGRRAWPAVAVVALLAILVPPQLARDGVSGPAAAGGAVDWQPFAPDAIPRHVAAGRVVFVDVTADWCVTCQVNKALVLDRKAVSERLNAAGIVAMQADWTRPDPAIADFLQRFSRYGIPFDVVFGPNAPEGKVLPELLTAAAVLAALDGASDGPAVVRR